jgi:hypothetical protein
LSATETSAASEGDGVGQGALNASPTPPSPLTPKESLATLGKNPFSLTIPITSRDNQSHQRRCAPTLIGIAGIVIGFIQGMLIDITGIRT